MPANAMELFSGGVFHREHCIQDPNWNTREGGHDWDTVKVCHGMCLGVCACVCVCVHVCARVCERTCACGERKGEGERVKCV